MSEKQAEANTPLESFFDLAYVLAFTQVTEFLSRHLNWLGMLQGAVLLATLWWAWSCYSWLTDAIPAHDKIVARLLILLAVAAMTLASLAMPEVFERTGALFVCAYLTVRLLHVILFVRATDEQPRTRRTILRLAPGLLGGPALLVVAVFVHGPLRGALWGAALLIDYGAPLVRGVRGLDVHAGHFAERYGLVIILALGESIAAIGEGHPRISAEVVLAALLGVILSAALWWAYFDYASQAAQNRLEEVRGDERAVLARDAYSYIHLAMVAGIVFMALGIKKTIAGVEKPLETFPAFALCCGVALYLLGLNAFRFRVRRAVRPARFVVAALSCAVLLLAPAVPSIVTLGVQTTLAVALIVIETLRPDEFRQEVRENGDESG
jgi:low temperature requirement protein LtrA